MPRARSAIPISALSHSAAFRVVVRCNRPTELGSLPAPQFVRYSATLQKRCLKGEMDMVQKWRIHLIGILMALALVAIDTPGAAAAQPTRRWLAEPTLFTSPKTIGPSGSQLLPDGITDIELSDGANGWATARGGILRLENGGWRRFQSAAGTTFLSAISSRPGSGMWIVGSGAERVPRDRAHGLMLQYVDGSWQAQSEVVRADGTPGPIAGGLSDVAVDPFGAWALGAQPSDVESRQRPLVLRF